MPTPYDRPDLKTEERNADNQELSDLIRAAMDALGWSILRCAAEAKKKDLPLSKKAIENYIHCRHRKGIRPNVVRNFATLFGGSKDQWESHFSWKKSTSLLIDSVEIMNRQKEFGEWDQVTVISSRSFLEATNGEFRDLVADRLNKGVLYTYYYPRRGGPYGQQAEESYLKFRDEFLSGDVAHARIFGFGVDSSRFRFFSDLHTIVHLRAKPNLDSAYAFITPAIKRDGQQYWWYPLPDTTWRGIRSNLDEARDDVADVALKQLPFPDTLTAQRHEYRNWFAHRSNVGRYRGLHKGIGHTGDRFKQLLFNALDRKNWPETVRYLDVGCGDGRISAEIATELTTRYAVDLVGIDTSAVQLEDAKKHWDQLHLKPVSTHALPFESFDSEELFDLITFVHSFYVIDEWYLRKVYRLLNPGGVAAIWLAKGDQNVISAIAEAIDQVVWHGQRRNSAEGLFAYAKACGLKPTAIDSTASIRGLLSRSGEPTKLAKSLFSFCALKPLTSNAEKAAMSVLESTRSADGHPVTDALILIRKKMEPISRA